MSRTRFTSDQIDDSVVKTDTLDAFGFLNKTSLAETLKEGVGQKINNLPTTLALFHMDDTTTAIVDSINNITLTEYRADEWAPGEIMENYTPGVAGKFNDAILGNDILDATILNHYTYDEQTQQDIENEHYLNVDGNWSIDGWLEYVEGFYGTTGFYLGDSGVANLGIRINPGSQEILISITDSSWSEVFTLAIDSTYGFTPEPETWFHLAFQKTGTAFSVWFNGTHIASFDLDYLIEQYSYVFGSTLSFYDTGVYWDELRITQDNPYPVGEWQEIIDPISGEPTYEYVVDDFIVETSAYPNTSGGIVLTNIGVKDVNKGTELKIWTGTEWDYGIIQTKDPNTLYIIVEEQ